jgi:hypothetical protein
MLVRVFVVLSAVTAITLAVSAPVGSHNVSCAIVGDSIAVGAGKHLRSCKLNAKIGIPSQAIIARIDPSADINVISAGSNDPDNPALRENLERIRERANRAIWILPAVPNARETVRKVAARHGDPVVSFAPSRDRVHPQSEDALARDIDAAIARAGEAATNGG